MGGLEKVAHLEWLQGPNVGQGSVKVVLGLKLAIACLQDPAWEVCLKRQGTQVLDYLIGESHGLAKLLRRNFTMQIPISCLLILHVLRISSL